MVSTSDPVSRLALSALALLAIGSNSCGNGSVVDASAHLEAAPDEVDFGPVLVGDRSSREVELRSVGRLPLSLSVTSAPAGFFVEPATPVLPAGGASRVQVVFAPRAAGQVDGKLILADGHESVEIAVRGLAVAAQLEAPARVDCGGAIVGKTAEGAVRVVNRSGMAVELTTRVIGPNAAAFRLASETVVVPAGGETDLGVTFAPVSRGEQEALLRLQPCAACDPLEVFLEGDGLLARLMADPASLAFGNVIAHATRTLVLKLDNKGDVGLTVGELRVVPETAEFRADGGPFPRTIGTTDPPMNLTVSFAPEAVGIREATLEIRDSDDQPLVRVPLDGNGVESIVVVTPPTLDFGSCEVNSTTSQAVTIAVQGEPVRIEEVTIEGEATSFWAIPQRQIPTEVGTPLDITVHYQPHATGDHGAVLVLRTNHPVEPERRITLAGHAVPVAQCRLAVPAELPFGLVGAGSVIQKPLVLTNTDTGWCQVNGIEFYGPSGPFSLEPVETPWMIEPSGSRSLEVTFAPPAGVYAASSSDVRIISNNASTYVHWVQLSGAAFEGELSATPDPIDFGTIPRGSPAIRTVTLDNVGAVPVSIGGFGFTANAPASLTIPASPPVPLVLAPGSGTTIALSWAPSTSTDLEAALQVAVVGQTVPKRVDIRGLSTDRPCGDECHTPTAVCSGRVVTEVTKEVVLPGAGIDPDGDTFTCQWSLRSAPAGSLATLGARLPCDTSLVPDVVGDYRLELEVEDSTGRTGRCQTEVHADPYSGLRVETFWDIPADVDLHLLNPAYSAGIDPFDAWAWGGTDGADCYYWTCLRGVANLPWPDTPGPLDDPSLDQDSQDVGPESIRIDVPSRLHPYWVGVHWLRKSPGQERVRTTTRVYCANLLAATETVTLAHREHVVLGSIDVHPDGTCSFNPSGVRLSY